MTDARTIDKRPDDAVRPAATLPRNTDDGEDAMSTQDATPDDRPARIAFWSEPFFDYIRAASASFGRRQRLDADDLYQECCLAAATWVSVRGDRPVNTPLLVRVVHHRMVAYSKWAKAKKFRTAHQIEDFHGVADGRRPDDPDARLDVQAAMAGMPRNARAFLDGRYFECRSFDELAESWGMTAGGVKSRQARAHEAMRAELAGGYGPDDARLRTTPVNYRLAINRRNRGRRIDWSRWGPISDQRDD